MSFQRQSVGCQHSGPVLHDRGSVIAFSTSFACAAGHALTKSAGLIIVGDEILAAKVEDVNTAFLCAELRAIGWHVKKARQPVPSPRRLPCFLFGLDATDRHAEKASRAGRPEALPVPRSASLSGCAAGRFAGHVPNRAV